MLNSIPSDTNYENGRRLTERLNQDAGSVNNYIDKVISHLQAQDIKFNSQHRDNRVYVHNHPVSIQFSSVQTALSMQSIWNNTSHTALDAIHFIDSYNFHTYNGTIERSLDCLNRIDKKTTDIAQSEHNGPVISALANASSFVLFPAAEASLDYDKKHPKASQHYHTIASHKKMLRRLYSTTKLMTIKSKPLHSECIGQSPKALRLQSKLHDSIQHPNNYSKDVIKDYQRSWNACQKDVNSFIKQKYYKLRSEIHVNYAKAFKHTNGANILMGYAENPVLGDIYQVTAARQELKRKKVPKFNMDKLIHESQEEISFQLLAQNNMSKQSNHRTIFYNDAHQLQLDSHAVTKFEKDIANDKKQDSTHNQHNNKKTANSKPVKSVAKQSQSHGPLGYHLKLY